MFLLLTTNFILLSTAIIIIFIPERCLENTLEKQRTTDLNALSRAAKLVETDKTSVKSAASQQGVSRSTLQRFLKCSRSKRKEFGYTNCSTKVATFTKSMELELAEHVKNLDNRFHGLKPAKVRELAYEFANANDIAMPSNWERNKTAGKNSLAKQSAILTDTPERQKSLEREQQKEIKG